MLKKLILKLKNRSFYYGLIATFSVISVITLCVSMLVSWSVVGRQYNSEIQNTNLQVLRQVQIYTDKNIYQDALNIINQHFELGSPQSPLTKFFHEERQLSWYDYYRSFRELETIKSKYPLMTNIFVYDSGDDALVETRGFTFNISRKPALYNYLPPVFYNPEMAGEGEFYIVGEAENASNGLTGITLMRSAPYYRGFGDCEGYIAVNMDVSRSILSLYEILPDSGELLIFDADGRLLAKSLSDASAENTAVDIAALLEHLSEGAGSNTFTYGGVPYALASVYSRESGWQYVSYMPLNTLLSESITTGQRMIYITVAIALCVIILTRFAASRLYRPIGSLMGKFGRDGASGGELAVITDALAFMESRVSDMQLTMSRNRDLLEYKLVTDILHNSHMFPEAELKGRLELIHRPFTLPGVCVLAVEFERSVYNNLSYTQGEYILAKTPELFSEWGGADFCFAAASQPMSRVTFILNVDSETFRELSERDAELVSYLQERLHIRLNLALSDMLPELRGVSRVYPSVLEALRYAFIYSYGNAFNHGLNMRLAANRLEIAQAEYEKYEADILNDGYDEALVWLAYYRSKISGGHCSYASVNDFLLRSYNIAVRIATARGLLSDAGQRAETLRRLTAATDLDGSLECVRALLKLIHADMRERSDSSRVIYAIKEYVGNHCEGELSVAGISRTFNLSPAYLSRLFKRVTGVNISSFIVDAKLEHAAKLLRTQSNISVADISNKLGYFTPSYFGRLFKEKYGVTPSQYRKQR